MDWSQVGKGEAGVELLLVLGDEGTRAACERAVVNVYRHDECLACYLGMEHRWVHLTDSKPKVSECSDEGFVPSSSGLFQPIQRLYKSQHPSLSCDLVPRQ